MRIAVDLDGVLAESMVVWCAILNRADGTNYKIDDLTSWSSWKIVGITKNRFYEILEEAWRLWREIPMTEADLKSKVHRLQKYGEVDILTGRSRATSYYAQSWLAHHEIPFNRFVRVNNIAGKLKHRYDLYIDDAPKLMPLISKHTRSIGILYTRPWNKDVAGLPRIYRANGWLEIHSIAKTVSENLTAKLESHR